MLAIPLADGAIWSVALFLLSWLGRAGAAMGVDRALEPLLVPRPGPGEHPERAPPQATERASRPDDLRLEDGWNLADAATQGLAFPCPVWLLPLRDLISVGVMVASYAGRRVEWRGHQQIADTPERPLPNPTASKGFAPAMMKTLFLQPPSFDGFDGGAGSRYQARREIQSFWFPTWLAQPAALVPGSKLIDAPPAGIGLDAVTRAAREHELCVIHTSTPSFAVRREGGGGAEGGEPDR